MSVELAALIISGISGLALLFFSIIGGSDRSIAGDHVKQHLLSNSQLLYLSTGSCFTE